MSAKSRRDFLRSLVGSSTLVSLGSAMPECLTRAALASVDRDASGDTVLVVLQLSGGNDGLNTLVPFEDDAYGRNRSTLRLAKRDVHEIDESLGFHPMMKDFARLYKEGRLGVIQGVGSSNPDRSHDVALRDWHTARPGDANCPTGWIGRAVDSTSDVDADSSDATGLFVGPIVRPFALNAEKRVVSSIQSARQWLGRSNPEIDADRKRSDPLAEFVRKGISAARLTGRQVETVLADTSMTAEYPPLRLAGLFKTIAQLIRANVGVRIFFTELGGGGIGGFDNHANQRDNHAALLRQLAESVAAFSDDLARDGSLDRVLLMTFSEFGRTLSENGRRGTGHGEAQPIFLIGGKLKGRLTGDSPDLTDLDQDAPKHQIDFRRVYATVLKNWLGFDDTAILGEKFEPLDVLG